VAAVKKSTRDKREPYVKLDHYMMDTAAWTSLSDGAVWLYLELRKQFDFSKGGDSHLELPYSKVSWRMSKGTFVGRMRELREKGFIRLVQAGEFPRKPAAYAICQDFLEISRRIVKTQGREAIRLGEAKKPSSRNNLQNLIGKRPWETA
jgi:hypothetical protein